MPIYVYGCPECGYEEERRRLISERDSSGKCPLCIVEMVRLVTRCEPFIKYKGRGWPKYRTGTG